MKKIVALVLSMVMVMALATTAFAADIKVQQWNPTGGTAGTGAWEVYYASTYTDLDDVTLGAVNNALPCYNFGSEYFVETTEAAATYKITCGASTIYVEKVDSTDVLYTDDAEIYKDVVEDDDVCGKLEVANDALTYYVAVNENNDDFETYYVAMKNGPTQLLVDGKIVDAKEVGDEDDLNAHYWVGDKASIVDHVYTAAVCVNCGKTADLYATATAAGKGAVKVDGLGYITKAAASFAATPAAPVVDTEKVESAETFDAGIAMYVGMSVMAAAGSAVVLKKKD